MDPSSALFFYFLPPVHAIPHFHFQNILYKDTYLFQPTIRVQSTKKEGSYVCKWGTAIEVATPLPLGHLSGPKSPAQRASQV